MRRLLPVDWVIAAWVAVASIVAVARFAVAPGAGAVLLAHGLLLVLIALVRFTSDDRRSGFLAELYPLFVVLALYGSLDLLAVSGGVRTHDPLVRRWEEALFGGQISRTWWQQSPSRLWSTVLHASYFSYYLVIPAGPLWFFGKGDRAAARRSILTILATFIACYAAFLFLPVAGPYYEFPRPDPAFLDNWAARMVYGVLENGSSYGAAFPSSHVAATLAATAAAAVASRRLAVVLAVPSVLLTIGVVYCQMHYAVDALAGILVAALVVAAVLAGERNSNRARKAERVERSGPPGARLPASGGPIGP